MDLPPDRASQITRPSTSQFHSEDLYDPETNTSQHNSVLSHQSMPNANLIQAQDRGREVFESEDEPLLLQETDYVDQAGQVRGKRVVRVLSAPNQRESSESGEMTDREGDLGGGRERLQSSGKDSFKNQGSNIAVDNTERHASEISGFNGGYQESEREDQSQKIQPYVPSQADTNLLDFGFTITQREEDIHSDRIQKNFLHLIQNNWTQIEERVKEEMEIIESESRGHFGENGVGGSLQSEDNLLDFGFTQENQPFVRQKQLVFEASQHQSSNDRRGKAENESMEIECLPKQDSKNNERILERQILQNVNNDVPSQQSIFFPQGNSTDPSKQVQIIKLQEQSVHDFKDQPIQDNKNHAVCDNSQKAQSQLQRHSQKANEINLVQQQKNLSEGSMRFVPMQIQSISEIRGSNNLNQDSVLLSNANQNIFNTGSIYDSKEIGSNINTSELLNFDSQKDFKAQQVQINSLNQRQVVENHQNQEDKSNSNNHSKSIPSQSQVGYKVEVIGCNDELLYNVVKNNDIYGGVVVQEQSQKGTNQKVNENRALLGGYYDAEEGPLQFAVQQKKIQKNDEQSRKTDNFKDKQCQEKRQHEIYDNIQWQEPKKIENFSHEQNIDSRQHANHKSYVEESQQTECEIAPGESVVLGEILENHKKQQQNEDRNRQLGRNWPLMQVLSELQYLRRKQIDCDEQKYNLFVQLIENHISVLGLQPLNKIGQTVLSDGNYAQHFVQLLILREPDLRERLSLKKFLVKSLQRKIKYNQSAFVDYADRIWNLRLQTAFSENLKPQKQQKLQILEKREERLPQQIQVGYDEAYSHINDSIVVHDASEYEGQRQILETDIKVNIVQPQTEMPIRRSILIENQGMQLRSGKETKKIPKSIGRPVKKTRKRTNVKAKAKSKPKSNNKLIGGEKKRMEQNDVLNTDHFGSAQTYVIMEKQGHKSIVQRRVSLRINPNQPFGKTQHENQSDAKNRNSSGERRTKWESPTFQGKGHVSKQKQKEKLSKEKVQISFKKGTQNKGGVKFESIKKNEKEVPRSNNHNETLTKSEKHTSRRKSVQRIQNLDYLKQHFRELEIDHEQLSKIQFTLYSEQDRQIADWLAHERDDKEDASQYSRPYQHFENEEVTVTSSQKKRQAGSQHLENIPHFQNIQNNGIIVNSQHLQNAQHVQNVQNASNAQNFQIVQHNQNSDNNSHRNSASQDKIKRQLQNYKIVIERVIDPDINNHGLYALLQVSRESYVHLGSIYFLTVISDLRMASLKTIDEDIKKIRELVNDEREKDNVGLLGPNQNVLKIVRQQKERREAHERK